MTSERLRRLLAVLEKPNSKVLLDQKPLVPPSEAYLLIILGRADKSFVRQPLAVPKVRRPEAYLE